MLTLRKLAITGGLSCGKSTVCRIFKELGAYTVSADDVVHQLLSSNADIIKKVVQSLGKDILVDQKIDRSLVANIVFKNDQLLKSLEEIVHPATYKEIDNAYRIQLEKTNRPSLFVAEIPLLFESHGEATYDFTVAVVASPLVCINRFCKKTGLSTSEYEKRTARQLSMREKAEQADYVIINNGTLEELNEMVKQIYFESLTS